MNAGPVRVEYQGRVAVMVIDNPPVNAGSTAVRAGLLEAVRRITADPAVDAAVVIGAGTTFVAGSDIREFGRPLADPQLPEVIAAIAQSPKPFVAAIHGAALGGGFELALGCDARVAAKDAVVGLPEVTLGMIPGAGGTQHVPRLAGIAKAIEIVCSGRRVPAPEALRIGLVDAVSEGDLRQAAVVLAGKAGLGKRRLADAVVPAEAAQAVAAAEKAALRAGKGRPPVAAAIAAIKASATLPYAEALARERQVFQELRAGPEAAALRHLFFAEREAAKVARIELANGRSVGSEGTIGERLHAAYRRQCEFMVEEGAFPEEVDAALEAFGFARGPFAVADMAGLDNAWRMRERLAARRTITADEIRWRALAALVNEAALLIAEGVAQRPAEVDLVFVSGYGFPRHEGGPLFWASRQDRAELDAALERLAAVAGNGFRRGDVAAALSTYAA